MVWKFSTASTSAGSLPESRRRRKPGSTPKSPKIYDLRTKAGLSQAQFAKLVGTTASVICRLEDADYEGHSLAMLNRIAAALHRRVEIRFVPLRGAKHLATHEVPGV